MSSALKAYLQRYVGSGDGSRMDDTAKSKSMKKKKKIVKVHAKAVGKSSNAGRGGVVIVDDDAVWQRERKPDDDEDEPDGEGEAPTVIEDVEVKQMQRMEALKTHRPYLSVANDGSGWVTVKADEFEAVASAGRLRQSNTQSWSSGENSADPSGKSVSRNLSPPRGRHDSPDASSDVIAERRGVSPTLSPPRRRHDSPGDVIPKRRSVSPTLSPPRRRRDSPDASSDVITKRRGVSPNLSPPRRRHASPDASSYVITKRRGVSPTLSPRRRHDSVDVVPRVSGKRRRSLSPTLSLPRRRHDSPDVFPDVPAKRSGSPTLSPPRRRRDSSDVPPGNGRDSEFSMDLSSPRRERDSSYLSPPRRRRDSRSISPHRRRHDSVSTSTLPSAAAPNLTQSQDLSPPRKKGAARMADGASAGLKSGREVLSDVERRRAAESKVLSELDPAVSGRGAETVFRDKRGRRLEGLEEMLRQQKGAAKPAEQPLEWGKGLAQKKMADVNVAELEAEKSKPFARYRDDAELDKVYRERVRFGDPMAHLVKKKTSEPILEDLGAREEMKASGFIVPQEIPSHSWLKRGVPPPPNRYDIRPGRHWDGVDRSTGFEQGLFKQRNEKKARDLEAYLWSVSDM